MNEKGPWALGLMAFWMLTRKEYWIAAAVSDLRESFSSDPRSHPSRSASNGFALT